ncbi:DNA primase [Slackia heliotrinireducens]|uniref:DNA primase n=1 Tax=Slackia heliotrinireducens (strain ATCC 29202 / DSM 20476 / NCTC 11029 / RHS 1) TaxID=471855 RepID=C7N4Z7_SLAHD|nr:DNA primase [Slackia heliotrinireducens]ACV21982.1 DNA primase, catalytic core [Slackia heliotrinireducens DSM 20476]VEG99863.1 DNA primase [Slackia heliotrinireducens]
MASIPEDDIRKVREASDLVAIVGDRVPLRQRGRDFWGCCPFHNEKTPSFKVDPNTQLWHCFGCGEGGDVISFVMKLDDIGFADAVRELARRAGIQITEDERERAVRGKKARLKEVCEATAAFYHTQLMRSRDEGAASARSYLGSRDLGGTIPKTWNLGFAPGRGALVRHLRSLGFTQQQMIDANVALISNRTNKLQDRFYNRIMFPIRDAEGDTIAFGGRVIGKGEPKYLNTQETALFHKSQVLFGLDMAKGAMASTGIAIIVEGYTDVIVLHEAGVKNVVATLGTALTAQHVRQLSRHAKNKIVYLFDGDEAGQRAADRAARFVDESMLPEAGRKQVGLYACTLPDNLDPADFVQQRGADALKVLLDDAKPLMRYAIDRKLAARDLTDYAEKSRVLPEVIELLAPIRQSLMAQEYVNYLADRLQVDSRVIQDKLANARVPRPMGEAADGPAQQPAAPANAQPAFELSSKERERLRIEQEFLALAATHPQIGIQFAAQIARTMWRSRNHGAIAEGLLTMLAEYPQATAAELITALDAACPGSRSVLTSASSYDVSDPVRLATFLSEELAIRDMEQNILSMNAEIKDSSLTDDERNILYASVVALQKELAALRRSHTVV